MIAHENEARLSFGDEGMSLVGIESHESPCGQNELVSTL